VLVSFGVLIATGGIPGAAVHAPPANPASRYAVASRNDAERSGGVVVTVRDDLGGAPLPGARVQALAIQGGQTLAADSSETDASGRALLANVPSSELWVIVDSPGKARASARVVAGTDRRSVEIALVPEHAFEIALSDDAGQPVADAEIEVTAASEPLPFGARARGDGTVHVGRLGAGPWAVVARALGYEDGQARASQDGEHLAMVLRKLGALVVRVVQGEDDDAAISAARVALAGATLWPAREGVTDEHGIVRIAALAAGTYALRATKGDLVSPIELGVGLARGEEKALTLRLAAGRWVGVRVVEGEDGEETANADPAGRDDRAAPVRGARVMLAESGLSPFPFEATTDAHGWARLGPIAPGSATVGARADGFVSRGLVLVSDSSHAARVVLVRASSLLGRVVDGRGFPVDGATIQVVGTDPAGAPILDDPERANFQAAHFVAALAGPAPLVPAGQLGVVPGPVPPIPPAALGPFAASVSSGSGSPERGRSGAPPEPWVTRSDGSFRVFPVSPGRVRALVRHPQYVEAQSEVVSLAPGAEAQVDVVLHEGGTLEGRVFDDHDRPVEGTRVVATALQGSLERSTHTASDGSFAFASIPAAVSLATGFDELGQPEVRMTVEVPEGGRREIAVRLPPTREPLALEVVDQRGRPVPAAQIRASSLAAEVSLRTTTFSDERGEATLKHARGLALRIEVNAPSLSPRVLTFDGSAERLRVELAPAERATGDVVAARGRGPIAHADVALSTELGVRHAVTDAAGAFSLPGLAPGSAALRVLAAGYASFASSIVVPESGGTRPFVMPPIELEAEGIACGTVVDASGGPVAGARVAKDHAPTWLAVGVVSPGVAVTNSRGEFTLGRLPEGVVALEAYAPDLGRGQRRDVRIDAGRTTSSITIQLSEPSALDGPREAPTTGSIAATLGETAAPVEVVFVSVEESSEAEHAGLEAGDLLEEVDGAPVHGIDDARTKLSGPVTADVVLRVRRGERTLSLRVAREAVHR
jgi:hypothetical protein